MEYVKAKIGRIFVVRFDHGEDPVFFLTRLAEKERIKFATISFLGAIKKGDLVTGPKRAVLPAAPHWTKVNDVWETVGFGTVSRDENDRVALHIHGAFGKRMKAVTGCLRKNAEVFITIEAVVSELKGAVISRAMDKRIGHKILRFN
jgi:predicted DNA-binding protein with PD1-like motif